MPADSEPTLRQLLKKILEGRDSWCWECGRAEEHALAALELLKQATRMDEWGNDPGHPDYVQVRDPLD